MDVNRQHDGEHDGGEDDGATLSLISETGGIADRASVARLLWQLGMLADGADPDHGTGTIYARFGDMPVRVNTGEAAVQLLGCNTGQVAPCYVGLAPNSVTRPACALTLSISVPAFAQRAAAAQRLCAMAALLTEPVEAHALFWSPAGLWSSVQELDRAVVAMEAAGLPPILHVVGFGVESGGADTAVALRSRGLDWFAGQELLLSGPRGMTDTALVRRAARLAAHMMVNGPVVERQQTDGLEGGERIVLVPQLPAQPGEAAVVRATISSSPDL